MRGNLKPVNKVGLKVVARKTLGVIGEPLFVNGTANGAKLAETEDAMKKRSDTHKCRGEINYFKNSIERGQT